MEENSTANAEKVTMQRPITETIDTESAVFFMDFSILRPAEKMR